MNKTTDFDLQSFCEACRSKQSENYSKFPQDYAARRKADEEIKSDMKEKLSAYFGYDDAPKSVKDHVFNMAWEQGHSAGYYEVASCMQDLFELVGLVQKELVAA